MAKWPWDDKNDKSTDQKLDTILQTLKAIQTQEAKIMAVLDTLKANVAALVASVAAEKTVIDSAVLVIQGLVAQMTVLVQQLQDAIAENDPVAIQAAADDIAAQNQAVQDQTAELAAAIPQGT